MARAPARTNRIALTGTPGTGKSSVAALLPRAWAPTEVGDLALRWGVGHRRPSGIEVDLPRLRRRLRAASPTDRPWVIVGHLAHLLPVDAAVVLRCHPSELARRLARARPGDPRARRENVVAEATDIVLVEAVASGRTVWEVDTTDRSVASVARTVVRTVRQGGPSRFGRVDWLSDPRATAHLLEG